MAHEDILKGKRRIHFIGIGGSGMFPIVQILHDKGYEITGSDNNESDIVRAERSMGVRVCLTQTPENLVGADLIVYTAAVLPDNPELMAAKASDVPVVERSVMLGYLSSLYPECLCVCGTHGKTTTTSMLTQILLDAGMDPSAVIGGKLKSINSYGRAGGGDVMVCEACEFADHFLTLNPSVGILLNIDNDHLDYFKTMDNLKSSFEKFCRKCSECVIYNGDDSLASEVVSRLGGKQTISFGLSENNDFYPSGIRAVSGMHTAFVLNFRGNKVADLDLYVPGQHNVLNACAACAAALSVGAKPEQLVKGLANFKGAGRRFEFIGVKNGFTVVDDYAHHPTEIATTLQAAKKLKFRQVWAVHQPFTYSRTKLLMDDFAQALSVADHVVLTEIMGGREKNTVGVYAKELADKINDCRQFATQRQAADFILENAQSGDLVITMGCGDIYKAANMIVFGKY